MSEDSVGEPSVSADDMGVSSGRVGPTGPGQVSTDGVRDTSPDASPEAADAPPEQTEADESGGDEVQPEGRAPVAGYPSADPRSAEKPYEPPLTSP